MVSKPYLTHEEEKEPVELLINWAMVNKEGSFKQGIHYGWEEGNKDTENYTRMVDEIL